MRRTLLVLLCSASAAIVPAAASADPSSGVSGTILGKGTSSSTQPRHRTRGALRHLRDSSRSPTRNRGRQSRLRTADSWTLSLIQPVLRRPQYCRDSYRLCGRTLHHR